MFVGTKEVQKRVHTIFVAEHDGREVAVEELYAIAD